jgi:RNA polymerase-binding transcription factor DksA
MAGGWSRDGAVQDQIDASVEDGIQQVRSRLPKGESLAHCEECDKEIPQARREAVPGQEIVDKENKAFNLFNRRGSKDSQLR